MSDRLPPAVFIMGPTASGKTDLALSLLKYFPFEIISVDSAMVYKGLDIGTAKPDPEELKAAPHRLIDIADPVEIYSAARFREDALKEMDNSYHNGRIPLLVGGTMLYFKALQEGLAALPKADPMIRHYLNEKIASKGTTVLHRYLRKVDPLSAQYIHPNDPQRIQRALEVYLSSGETLSDLKSKTNATPLPYRILKFILFPRNRELLHQRIAERFALMLDKGFVEEVIRLKLRFDLNLNQPSMRAVGYRQIWHYLEGKYCYDEMKDRGIIATRQLAKRQLTWLRMERNAECIDMEDLNIDNVLKKIAEFLQMK